MQSNTLKRIYPNKRSVQVGRGGKRGKTSGRGGKGQTARAGHKVRPEMRDVIKRLPKLRGRGKHIFKSFQTKATIVPVALLENNFADGEAVTSAVLTAKGLVATASGKQPRIKIVSDGELTKKLTITGCALSAGARAKIEKAGGKVI